MRLTLQYCGPRFPQRVVLHIQRKQRRATLHGRAQRARALDAQSVAAQVQGNECTTGLRPRALRQHSRSERTRTGGADTIA